MTKLGEYLIRKSASKAEIARKTGISKSRISELTNNPSTQLRVWEMYYIALALDVDACEVLTAVCDEMKLPEE